MSPHELYKLIAKTIFVNVPVSFIVGWMTARFRLKYCYLITTLGLGVGLYGFLHLPQTWAMVVYVIGFGASFGTFGTLITVTWPRYYGRRHLGKISGWVMMFMVFSSALGPLFFDVSKQLFGSYSEAYFVCMIAAGVFFFLCCLMENPQRKLAGR